MHGMNLKEHINFKATSTWNHRSGGSAEVEGFTINYDTPREYEGEETAPCPDQLFLSSIAGCLNNTFLYYKKALGAETLGLRISVSAEVEMFDLLGYRVTQISVDMNVSSPPDLIDVNRRCAERAKEFCHLTRSIEPAIPIKFNLTIDSNAGE